MKKLLLSAALISVAALAITAKKTSDPVVMTIDNRDVKLSEFEYLYNKNNNQQLAPLTFDEYIDMFVNYKLKVADALNAKIDTTASFKSEFQKFRRDLAEPYLKDAGMEEELVLEAYGHTAEEVYVSHVMLSAQDPRGEEKLDSIRQLIIDGKITFEEAASDNSVDRGSAQRGGHMGWVTGPGRFPWTFEKAAYDTPIGEISEVINSGVGYHIVMPEKRRPNRGEVNVQHILLLTRGVDPADVPAVKARIDSLYKVVNAEGVDFGEIAKKYSEDPGSAQKGGELGWFGSGRMVAEFDSVAFALPVGGISEPFSTSYGYHIIHKLAQRDRQPLEELRPMIEKSMQDDVRAEMPIKSNIKKAAEATNSRILDDYKGCVEVILSHNDNECDSALVSMLKTSDCWAYNALGKVYKLSDVLDGVALREGISATAMKKAVDRAVENAFDNAMIEYQIDQLMINEPSYSNLVNEYRDGILLFDISNQKVWEKASKDTEGQKEYFEKNREKYSTWTAPKYKAYVIFAQNDSTLNQIMSFAEENFGNQKITDIDQESLTTEIKRRFGRAAKVERVIAAKGDNPITDYLGFGGEKPDTKNPTWTVYAAFAGEVIDQPEEVSDIKGVLISDYQSELEKAWLNELHKQYKVSINKKELNKANK